MELIVISKLKKTIIYINKILVNYSKNSVLKNKIEVLLYDLLENMYYSNYLKGIDRINNLYLCLVKIKMLDFYLKLSLENKIISYKRFINLCSYLNEIVKMVYGWINSEKSK